MSKSAAGQSYYSDNGTRWTDATTLYSSDVFRLKGGSFGTEVPLIHPLTLTDTDTGVTLTTAIEESTVTETATLSVGAPVLGEAAVASLDAISNTRTAYSITLEDGGEAVEPSDPVSITIPLPAGYNGQYSKVYYIDSLGAATDVEAVLANGTLVFSAAQLGIFVVADTTPPRLPGDVNSDGAVDMKDSIILRRYLAGWTGVTINERNADVNADNTVNLNDSIILRRYLSNWSGVSLV